MSQRPGIHVDHFNRCPAPPWPHKDLPDPRSQVPSISAEVRAHWPDWATRGEVMDTLAPAIVKALRALDKKLPVEATTPGEFSPTVRTAMGIGPCVQVTVFEPNPEYVVLETRFAEVVDRVVLHRADLVVALLAGGSN